MQIDPTKKYNWIVEVRGHWYANIKGTKADVLVVVERAKKEYPGEKVTTIVCS